MYVSLREQSKNKLIKLGTYSHEDTLIPISLHENMELFQKGNKCGK